MTELPSFRPRAALGFTQRDGRVTSSPEFLRYLDTLRRTVDVDGVQVLANTTAIAANTAAISALQSLATVNKGIVAIDDTDSPYAPGAVFTVLCDASAGAIVVNLTAEADRILNIKKTDSSANAVTLTPVTGTVEGSATADILLSGMSLTVHCDGTDWSII